MIYRHVMQRKFLKKSFFIWFTVLFLYLIYYLWGGILVSEIYYERSFTFLNNILEGRKTHSIEFYQIKLDNLVNKVILLFSLVYFLYAGATISQIFSKIAVALESLDKTYNIQSYTKNAIMIVPIIIIFLQGVFWLHPTLRSISFWLLKENHPIELLTFAFLIVGGVVGLFLARMTRIGGDKKLVYVFYTIFSIGLLFIAMEEVAWGQWLLGFETPAAWSSINSQGETTIHNLSGMQGHSEFLRLLFGLGGLIGIWLSFSPSFRKIGAPVILLPWFLIISIHASVDVFNDFISIQKHFDYFISSTSELIEFFIAITAFLYIQLNMRMLRIETLNHTTSNVIFDEN